MAPNLTEGQIAPLVEKELELVDAAAKGSEAQVNTNAAGVTNEHKTCSLLYNRSTYYWIALIAQFSQMIVGFIGYGFSLVYDKNTRIGNLYYFSGMYSWFSFLLTLHLIRGVQRNKSNGGGPKRILAGQHYLRSKVCATVNIVNFLHILLSDGISKDSFVDRLDDPSSFITPLSIGCILIAAMACMKAARITRLSATSARGTELVNDPEYRVPAWHLATMDESQTYRSSDREVQLSV